MLVARASRPPTAHIAAPTQNSHQIGPRIRPNPPTRNAAIMVDTATHDTGRPWCDTVAGPPVAGLSWPLSADCPATMSEPNWSAMQAAPLRCAAANRHGGQDVRPGIAVAVTLLWRSQLSGVRPAPKARHHRLTRLP